MKYTLLLLAASIALLSTSCTQPFAIKMSPVKVSYIHPETGIKVTERIGDGVFGPEIDLSELDLGNLDVKIEPSK
jgi:hypothetical protein